MITAYVSHAPKLITSRSISQPFCEITQSQVCVQPHHPQHRLWRSHSAAVRCVKQRAAWDAQWGPQLEQCTTHKKELEGQCHHTQTVWITVPCLIPALCVCVTVCTVTGYTVGLCAYLRLPSYQARVANSCLSVGLALSLALTCLSLSLSVCLSLSLSLSCSVSVSLSLSLYLSLENG